MTTLIRFHSWLIDREQIKYVKIICDKTVSDDFEKIDHIVCLELKSGEKFNLTCLDRYDAIKELNFLTLYSKAEHIGDAFDHCILEQVYIARRCITGLEFEVKKLMKSYSKRMKK